MELETCLSAPGDWQRVTIEDVCVKFTSGGTPSRRRPEFYQDGIVPWVKTKELLDVILQDAEEWITEEAIADSSAKRLPRNTVLMAMYGATVGQLGILGREMACNQACAAMIVDDAKCDYRFLYYLLLANRRQIVSMATGAAQQNLSGAQIKGWTIALPEREEQRAIAHILGTLDDKIELNRRRNQTLEAMARALFKDWFVDFGPVRAKMEGREPYLPADLWQLFPDRLDDEGKPEGWETQRISDYLSLAYGKSLPAGKRLQGDIPVYGSGGITGFHNEALVNGPAVIVGRKGTVGSLYWEDRPCFPIDTVFYVQPAAPLPFCYYLLESLPLRDMNTDAAVPGLNRENVYRLEVAAPPPELVSNFAETASCFRENIAAISKDSETLAQLRDTLLPKLISGELRIADAEKFLERVT
ncbi:restriction endonuclease subunit S [Methylobacillus sp.]|uniref:restriction endonuclease subunit S n=1 Tax=Methylobacillus sp. TaxID=56818 RepID=UPI0012C2ED61|nr:restriction endonuclease subunit S [Methylobacillus sp.]MPS47835.1 restriction endonuclease subunit S [Methylobacillus sp.]